MQLQQRINAFAALGQFIHQFGKESVEKDSAVPFNDIFFDEMLNVIAIAQQQNTWFTKENLTFTFKSWGQALTQKNIEQWLQSYVIEDVNTKEVAVIMAGNIPLVGFHDFICVLLAGHKINVKLSSNDQVLLPFLANYLSTINSEFSSLITFTSEKLEGFDAVIATGSNNTAKYFNYYFGKYPHIIRKNRNSVAVLTGNETKEQLVLLANDIFRYFGLGCRNVSKIFIPEEYDFTLFFEAMYAWKNIINNHKYINNYDYNKAVYLMSNVDLLDNEFMLLKEDDQFASPISVVFYEYYQNLDTLNKKLNHNKQSIQAIIANCGIEGEINFGKAQNPNLWDYADGVDTMKFLNSL